ncbi:N-acetyltransferase [Pseudomonas sp. 91RF]|jgi:GNAT superfamily N-acetyltransferase|uniref:GNAT family N-acetyltransferase n=1 Tax=Pseudomonas sp. 91RF TaxID=2292261 RepID=UPI000E66EC71|nr:GNAT family N-acetyltransferase [Pseudomonas sp. 91RF]RIJ09757.1 N-acetyltransferase [Pseudomonas sp. 91RF]
MTFLIRPARPADAAALPVIERSAAELFRLDPALAWLADSDVPDAAQHLQAIEQGHVWVAENTAGQLAGFLRAVEIDNQLHVEELSVSQHFQGQGIGRKLLLGVIEHARRQQLEAVTLTTFRDLPWNAPFYQRMGFVPLNELDAGPRLIEVLNDEIAHGLPGERRCAMRLMLG